MLWSIFLVIFAICLIAMCFAYYDKRVNIPGDFSWVKGLLGLLLLVGACLLVWVLVVGGTFLGMHFHGIVGSAR